MAVVGQCCGSGSGSVVAVAGQCCGSRRAVLWQWQGSVVAMAGVTSYAWLLVNSAAPERHFH